MRVKIQAEMAASLYLAAGAWLAPPPAAQVIPVVQDGKRVFVNENKTLLTSASEPGDGARLRPAVWHPAPYRSAGANLYPRDFLRQKVEEAAERHQVDPELVHAIIDKESKWDAYAVSPKGALGLMQLMPTTAERLGVKNPFDPEQNLAGGVRHLRELLERYDGDLELTLAAYNAGGGAVDRAGGVPPIPETREYVQKICDAYFSSDSGKISSYWHPRRRIYQVMGENGKRIFTNE